MKPEELKIIAEYMGYEHLLEASNEIGKLIVSSPECYFEYNPLTNAEQCLELIHKFQPSIDWINSELCQVTIYSSRPLTPVFRVEFEGQGKTINEAVCKAVLEFFNATKD